MPKRKPQQSSVLLSRIMAIAVTILLLLYGYQWWLAHNFNLQYQTANKKIQDSEEQQIKKTTPTDSLPTDPIAGETVVNNDGTTTYFDRKAGFSFTLPTEHFRVSASKEGEYARINSISITVYHDYDGGSRREWYLNKVDSFGYEMLYEEYEVDGYNALIVMMHDPGSMSGKSMLIFKGSTVYQVGMTTGDTNNDDIKKVITNFKIL